MDDLGEFIFGPPGAVMPFLPQFPLFPEFVPVFP